MKNLSLDISQELQKPKTGSGKSESNTLGKAEGQRVDANDFLSLLAAFQASDGMISGKEGAILNNIIQENPELLSKMPSSEQKLSELEINLLKGDESSIEMKNEAIKKNKLLEVRNLLKGHDLGLSGEKPSPKLNFSSSDDFVKSKNILNTTTPTIKTNSNNSLKKYGKEAALFDNKIVKINPELSASSASEGTNLESIDNNSNVFKIGEMTKESGTNITAKVIDLSNISSSNREDLLQQVTKIIERNNIKTSDSMDVLVKHEELGQFRIEVSRTGDSDQLNLKIISKELDGHKFFVENERQLTKTLSDSGIKITDIKISLSGDKLATNSSSNEKSSDNNFSGERGQEHGFSEKKQQSNQGSERRKQLWQAFRENAEYASA